MFRQMLGGVGMLAVLVVALFGSSSASAAGPVPFATASAPCSSEDLVFPVQSTPHSDVIFFFRSIGSEGKVVGWGAVGAESTRFGVGDSGWVGVTGMSVEAGTAPELFIVCTGGSVEAMLAERPTTPATFSGVSSPGYERSSALPFSAPGSGQYVLDLSITQGAVKIEGISGILQSSGTYLLGDLGTGSHNLLVNAQAGPTAVWSATVRLVPVAINGLAFGRRCMAPGAGVPARFSVTGDTDVGAAIRNGSGGLVRDLGSFPVRQGKSSIPWDGRNGGGGPVANGTYVLALTSTDPQGQVTSAQAKIAVASSAPRITMTARRKLGPRRALRLTIQKVPCGTSSVRVEINGYLRAEYRGRSVPSSGRLLVPPRGYWRPGKNRWRAVATDPVGNKRVSSGVFRVRAAS